MIDRWYYMHGGQTLGPVTAAQLRQLMSNGQLDPSDLLWPEGRQPNEAVPAQAAVNCTPPSAAAVDCTPPLASVVENKPDWLDDIRAATGTEPKPIPSSQPDWLDDVRVAEENEQAMLTTFEWDGEDPLDEETIPKKPADELEQFLQLLPKRERKAPASTSEAVSASPRLVIGSATTRGRVRDHNEDSVLVQQCTWSHLAERHDVALIVVADGMGGHAAGERASALVIRAVSAVVTPLLTAAVNDNRAAATQDLDAALDRGLVEANRLVRETAKDNAALKGMGSTAVALLIWDGRASIHLVGDCRVYHWRQGILTQVTRDQTLVARMVELGHLSPEEAATHPRRNEVAQAVGKYALIEPGRYELALNPGDWLIASSDGLQAHVSDSTLAEVIAKADFTAAELANRLVEMANQGGGSDNCTVVAVKGLG
jgi:serine/threonine protein phosphatase PrpC